VPESLKAYVGWVGDPTHWVAHTEVDDDPARGERMECHSEADAVAWARERTDWVLVVTEPLQWTEPAAADVRTRVRRGRAG
jgi:hypothetical protein